MASKLKNIIIFIVIGGVLVLGYLYFIKKDDSDTSGLVTSVPSTTPATDTSTPATAAGGEFLTLLLSVKSIKLNDSIFSDPAFQSLSDSSIQLTPDGSEGRPNPFAPLMSDEEPEDSDTITSSTPSGTSASANASGSGTSTPPKKPAGQ